MINTILKRFGYRLIKIEDAHISVESSKKERAATASRAKADRARAAVQQAVNDLENRGESVTIASVSRLSGVARNTAKKYLKFPQKNQ
jgi:Fic family protein